MFEFGCGTGSTALLHAPYVKHIHATDYAKKMIEIANEKREEQLLASVKQAGFSLEEQWNPESSVPVVFLVGRKSP